MQQALLRTVVCRPGSELGLAADTNNREWHARDDRFDLPDSRVTGKADALSQVQDRRP